MPAVTRRSLGEEDKAMKADGPVDDGGQVIERILDDTHDALGRRVQRKFD